MVEFKNYQVREECFLNKYSLLKYIPCCELPIYLNLSLMNSEFSKPKIAFLKYMLVVSIVI